jgi:hypothetical protein
VDLDETWQAVRKPEDVLRLARVSASWPAFNDQLMSVLPQLVGEYAVRKSPAAGEPVLLQELRLPGLPRLYIKATNLRPNFGDVLAVTAAFLTHANVEVTGIVRALAKLRASLSLLSEDEAEVIHVIAQDSRFDAHKIGLGMAELRMTFTDSVVPLDGLIKSLEKKGVITIEGDVVRLVF